VFYQKDLGYKYFYKLTAELLKERNLSQGVSKSNAGVEENVDVIPEYQLA